MSEDKHKNESTPPETHVHIHNKDSGSFKSTIFILIVGILIGAGGVLAVQSFVQQSCFGILPPEWCQPAPQIAIPAGIQLPEVEPIQALSRLTTTRFNYSQIVTGQVDMPTWLATLYGDGLVMVAVGHIDAGIDASEITPEDINYNQEDNTLWLLLPHPTLQNCFLDENQSYTVQRNTAIFASGVTNLEDSVRQYAVQQYRDQALEDDILGEAKAEVREVMTEFLKLTVEKDITITITFEDPIPDAEYPESCR